MANQQQTEQTYGGPRHRLIHHIFFSIRDWRGGGGGGGDVSMARIIPADRADVW